MRWELASRAPIAALAPYVAQLQGYDEAAKVPVARREFAGTAVVVILEFEPHLRVYEPGQSTRHSTYPGGFVAGLEDSYSLTEHAGHQAGIQLNLHPLGARRLLGIPLRELRGRPLGFEDVLPAHRQLSAELADLRSWDARFDRVERFLQRRLNDAPATDPAVGWALDRIAASGGKVDLAQLVSELGYSHKHVISRFHDQVGVPPKLWARLVRFDRVRRELAKGAPRSWAELAMTCGYYDQAHLARDVRQFTGASPRALLGPRAFQDALDNV